MKKQSVYKAMLPVKLLGEGCTYCPALTYRTADETRACKETGEHLLHWKTQRGECCPLMDVEELYND